MNTTQYLYHYLSDIENDVYKNINIPMRTFLQFDSVYIVNNTFISL